jgi:F0F1-type ATP synthase membrane subunit c/vacuolar-type H+-ATPase subunit K
VLALLCLAFTFAAVPVLAADEDPGDAGSESTSLTTPAPLRWDLSLSISVAIGIPCLAAGYAVGKVGAAALGAASEKPELLTRSLIFVALAEGIAIYGLLVAVLLYRQF